MGTIENAIWWLDNNNFLYEFGHYFDGNGTKVFECTIYKHINDAEFAAALGETRLKALENAISEWNERYENPHT